MSILNVRGIDTEVAAGIKLAAAARGMTIGQYVAALYGLHRLLLDISAREDASEYGPEVFTSDTLAKAGLPIIRA